MAKSLNLPFDQIATVPIFSDDSAGAPVGPVPAGTTVASDNASVTATLASDNSSVMISATAQTGSANLTLSAPNLESDTLAVAITTPQAVGVAFNVAAASFAPNPTPPTS